MNTFREVDAFEFACKPFELIGRDWTLVIAPHGGSANPMTASWAGMGMLWQKPVVFTFVRPQRFTHGLLDAAGEYSVAVFGEEYRERLNFCGRESGRDTDKIARCGWTLRWEGGAPYFDEARLVFICRKLARQPIAEAGILDPAITRDLYPERDFHDLYISAVEKILARG